MLSHVAILLVSLGVLAKGAGSVVEHAARLGRRFEVSDLAVGLVVTSLGTSLPEISSSVAAAITGSPGLVIGSVVGSNIANIGLVLGVAAIVRPFGTDPKMHDRDGFILVASCVLFFAFALDNRIGRADAVTLICVYIAYVVFLAYTDRAGVEHRFKDFLKFVFDFEYAAPLLNGLSRRRNDAPPRSDVSSPGGEGFARDMVIVVISLVAVVVAARYAVVEASAVARLLSVPENLVGLSIVAVGTSLPELLVAIAAARRGNAEMIVGNVMGSNIANVLLAVGLAGVLRPLDVPEFSVVLTTPVMLFFSLALLHFIRSDWRISRRQGVVALAAYIGFLATAFVQN